MTEDVLVEREGPVMTVTLNRPEKHNALTFAMYTRLADACANVPDDVRVLVVTGAGGKAFAAGTDIAQFRAFASPQDGIAYESRVDEILSAVEACRVPVIAAIAGACTGGGAAIAACCDMRIGTRDMRYGYPIARTLGNCLSARSLQRLIALIGEARTRELLFTARLMQAEECASLGLVNEVLDDHAALMARVRSLAGEIAANAPLTIATTREMLRRLRDAGARIDDHDLVGRVYTSADFREGLDSFLAKRKPVWTGR